MNVKVGRNDKGWEVAVLPMQLTDKGKELFGLEEVVRVLLLDALRANDG